MPYDFTFDAALHEYRLDGVVLPSVTQIIKSLTEHFYRHVPPEHLAARADLGRRVHEATEFDDDGDLDEDTVADDVRPYLIAWRKFRADTGAVIIANEREMFHAALGFAGTLDCVVAIKGKHILIDKKITRTLAPPVYVQLAGYEMLANVANLPTQERAAVQLRESGDYRYVESIREYEHRAAFMGCLASHRWRQAWMK